MEIVRIDDDAATAAGWLCDQHVGQMIMETAQLLSAAHWVRGYEGPNHTENGVGPYKRSPRISIANASFVWTLRSMANYRWAWRYGLCLAQEYRSRFGREHPSRKVLEWLRKNEPSLPDAGTTPFEPVVPKHMDQVLRVEGDPVATCRRHYAFTTAAFQTQSATWKRGGRPEWIDEIRASVEPAERERIVAGMRAGRARADRLRKGLPAPVPPNVAA
jgi:hypothetical protein